MACGNGADRCDDAGVFIMVPRRGSLPRSIRLAPVVPDLTWVKSITERESVYHVGCRQPGVSVVEWLNESSRFLR